ncbi:PH domain-containing protein [Natronomonas sp. EA1]|uniref:PH domain-containing protein n=1 Tax=Natronomonas sp. EA1 TaxID=3421655 RepID=UPI003EBAA2D1
MRLHPLSVLYRAGDTVSRLAWILVLTTVGASNALGLETALLIVGATLVVALAYHAAAVTRFEYALTDDTVDIRSGVFSRTVREIPLRRVQNVDIVRNVVHRLFGLAEVRIETAGGGETEARLRYVTGDEARRLQREVGTRSRGETEGDAPEREELFAVTMGELLLLGVIGMDLRLLSALTALLPIILPSVSDTFPLSSLFTVAPLLAGGIIAVAAIASAVIAVTNYYGFRLSRVPGELQYERGFLQQFSGTIPLSKVQSVVIEESVLARRLGYASLTVETAGYAPGESGAQSAVPIATRDRVLALAREVEPFGDPDFERPPKRARTRYVVRYALALLVLVGTVTTVVRFFDLQPPIPPLAGVALLPLSALGGHLKWRNLSVAFDADHVITREGFWTRRTRVVPYYRIQTVIESRTLFQRRRSLATVTVDTAGTGGFGGGNARMLDIDAARAEELREAVADRLQGALVDRRIRNREPERSLDGTTGATASPRGD